MQPHIFYDFDGTLADSLPAHIKFLHDMNSRFDVDLELPAIEDYEACKRLVKTPMIEFIRNAGFPENLVKRVLMMYKKTFRQNSKYKVKFFNGMPNVIESLFQEGYSQSIISSNFLRNFQPVLERENLDYLFLHEIDRNRLKKYYQGSKAECMIILAERLKLPYSQFVYVGDTEEDYDATQQAEVVFVGVGYGWGISPDDTRFPVAESPSHLQKILMRLSKS